MENKTIIIELIKEKKRYWGKLLYQEYSDLFQKIHSNQKLAELISKDLGFSINEKQIENIKTSYHSTQNGSFQAIKTGHKTDESEQNIYDKIYQNPKKEGFNLDNL